MAEPTMRQIREAIANAVGQIEGVTAYPYRQAQVNPIQAEVYRRRFDYDGAQHQPGAAGETDLMLAVRFLAPFHFEGAQELFDELVEETGPKSAKAAIERDPTLRQLVDFVVVTTAEAELVVTVGAVDYLAQDVWVTVGL